MKKLILFERKSSDNYSSTGGVNKILFLVSVLLVPLSLLLASNFGNLRTKKSSVISDKINSNIFSDCSFTVTKAKCNANGFIEICAESVEDPTCNHAWELKNNNTTIFTSTDPKFCEIVGTQQPNNFLLSHACNSQDICFDQVFDVECEPNCEILNFSYTVSNCTASFEIFNPYGANYTWSFGDGSPSLTTTESVLTHNFPVYGGSFEVCVTWFTDLGLQSYKSENISSANRTYYTCCFTVNIPDCVECESPSITWLECPVKIGNECCIDLTFHSPYSSPTYDWVIFKGGNQIFSTTTTSKELKHSFIGIGPYTVCVTFYLGGIPFECCSIITLAPCDCCETADFSFETKESSIYNTCVNKIFEIEPVCSRLGMTKHKWIFSDGVVIWRDAIDPAPPDHIFTNYVNTTGEVCVTHEVYCDDQLQDAVTKCKAISPGAYLGVTGQELKMSDLLVNLTPIISVFQFITQNANISVPLLIDGIITNDINTSFSTGYWWMAKASQINVNSNTSFGLSGTHIRTAVRVGFLSCCRWKGIKAQPRSILNWDGATISDAEIMLETVNSSPAGARLNFKNNNFLENVIGIKSVNHRFTCGDFHNNIFTGCKECTVLCGCSQSPCIYIDMTGGTSLPITFPVTGPKNSVSSFDQGFEVYNLNLNVKNFDIFNITLQGIYYEKSISSNRNLILDLLTFDNMQIGVVDIATGGGTHNLTAIAAVPYNSLKMSNVWQGYNIGVVRTKLIGNVNNNEINTNGGVSNFGISVGITGSSANQFTANNNRLNINGGEKSVGIALSSGVPFTQDGIISNNVIVNEATNSGAGIFVNNWRDTRVTDNHITISTQKAGIEFTGGGSSLIKCNSILFGNRGMSFSISPENDIVSNSCYGNFNSNFFSGNCSGFAGSFIGKNGFSNSISTSSLYARTTLTGLQNHDQYNSWSPVNSINRVIHADGAFGAMTCAFWAPSNSALPSIHYPKASPQSMLDAIGPPAGMQSIDCFIGGGGGNDNYSEFHRTSAEAAEYYNNIILTSGYFDNFTPAQNTSTLQSIFDLLILNPSWLSEYSGLYSFYNANLNSFVGKSSQIRNGFSLFIASLNSQYQNLLTYYNQQDVLKSQLIALDELLNNETDPILIQSLLNQMEVIQLQIDVISQTIETQIAIDNVANLNTLNNIQMLNSALVANLQHEVNEKIVNNILIKLYKSEALTSADEGVLRSVAQTCFADGGRSVYEAVDLCIYLFKEYYTQADCPLNLGGEILENRIIDGNSILIQPNPTNSEFHLTLPEYYNDRLDISFALFDHFGKEIKVSINPIKELSYRVMLDNINHGIYYLIIKTKEGIESTKIVVSK
ncbi:MAG: hypothetical protein IT264_14715 [Saprospiraceae bacterium]|nr:hypothetical protein [Saprospiraceae bacterium]